MIKVEHKIRLGTAVKKARQTLGITQFELAERAGVSLRTITDLENYQANPQFDTLCQIIDSLNLPLSEIFYQKKESTKLMGLLTDELSSYTEDELEIALSVLRGLHAGLHPNNKK